MRLRLVVLLCLPLLTGCQTILYNLLPMHMVDAPCEKSTDTVGPIYIDGSERIVGNFRISRRVMRARPGPLLVPVILQRTHPDGSVQDYPRGDSGQDAGMRISTSISDCGPDSGRYENGWTAPAHILDAPFTVAPGEEGKFRLSVEAARAEISGNGLYLRSAGTPVGDRFLPRGEERWYPAYTVGRGGYVVRFVAADAPGQGRASRSITVRVSDAEGVAYEETYSVTVAKP